MSDTQPRPGTLIHITGASGSGASTLGAALAQALAFPHFDGDDYYWLPSTPPFQHKRAVSERIDLLRSDLDSAQGAVLSGSIVGWDSAIEDGVDLIVFLYLPAAIRVERLRQRELAKYGQVDDAFLSWAAQYDQGPPEGRSLAKHEAWLKQRRCPVLRLETDEAVAERVNRTLQALRSMGLRPKPAGS